MRLKLLVGMLLIFVASAVAAPIHKSRSSVAGQQPEKLKVKAVQLEPVDGAIPVQLEIMPEATEVLTLADSDSKHGTIHYKVKNTSKKGIEAFGVDLVVTALDASGIPRTSSVYRSRDTAPHPDIRDFHQMTPIAPGTEATSGPDNLKLSKSLVAIKDVTLIMDFVLFDDGTVVGCASPKLHPSYIFNNFIRLLAVRSGDVVLQLRQSRSLLPTPAAALPLAQAHPSQVINGFVIGDNIRNSFSKCGADGFH
jgi:hypothetical protein